MNSAAPSSPAARRQRRRHRAERRFRLAGAGAVLIASGFLLLLLSTMVAQGLSGFVQTRLALPVDLSAVRQAGGDPARLEALTAAAAVRAFGSNGERMLADQAWRAVRDAGRRGTGPATVDVPAAAAVDLARKGRGTPVAEAWVARLEARRQLSTRINWPFLTRSDSVDAASVGIWGALKGSLLTMAVTLAVAFPVGVLAAFYLEEYAPRNRWTDLIEVSINNLAAVPSIIFGLLGLALFLGLLGLPRSAPLVGGLTLALMTLPVIVITSRSAVRAVPRSVREAALSVGASPVQVVFHHVLPLALPGILTGTIIGMARALGETAPLLMIGMRAFIAGPPGGLTDPATVLPVQIFLWSDEVNRSFVEKTSAAILVLLTFLLAMNGAAIYLRNRLERHW